jgi:SSS family solute:Na+ symporter
MNYTDYTIVGIFSGLTFLVGAYFYSWVKSGNDFYVAGRWITPFILASLVVVTNMNLFSFAGQSGIAYQQRISIIRQPWTGNPALVFAGLFIVGIDEGAKTERAVE